jgi:hypothetical protein
VTAIVAALALMAGPWSPPIRSAAPMCLDLGSWEPAPAPPAAAPIPMLGIPINDPVPVYRPPPTYYLAPFRACVTCGRGR